MANPIQTVSQRKLIGIRFRAYSIFPYSIIAISTFILSSILLEKYIYGDQIYYRIFYRLAGSADIPQISHIQKTTIGSQEPLFGLFIWVASRIFEKTVFISILNAIFVCQLYGIFKKYNASNISFILVSVGYYTIVCLTSAERLKFSLIFIFAFILTSGPVRYVFAALAPAIHFQTGILYVSSLLSHLFSSARSAWNGRGESIRSILFTLIAISFLAYFVRANSGAISGKILGYARLDELETIKTILLTVAMLVVLADKMAVVTSMAPVILLAFVVGDDRVNMMGYVVFVHRFLVEGKSRNIVFTVVNLYFAAKTLPFAQDIMAYGTGYLPGR